jgi:hypothetical protein
MVKQNQAHLVPFTAKSTLKRGRASAVGPPHLSGSWYCSMRRLASARALSVSSTTLSGGSPPARWWRGRRKAGGGALLPGRLAVPSQRALLPLQGPPAPSPLLQKNPPAEDCWPAQAPLPGCPVSGQQHAPLLLPSVMIPRVGWKRMPSSRAARMVSSRATSLG